jgi:hypothetical protein
VTTKPSPQMVQAAQELARDAPAAVGLLDPNFYVDVVGMDEVFRGWRAEGPVYRDEATGLVAMLTQPAVLHVERNPAKFISGDGYRSWPSPHEDNMIAQDDPEH